MGRLVELASLNIAHLVEREDHPRRKLAPFFEHRIKGLGIKVGMFGHLPQLIDGTEQLMEHKPHIAQRGGVLRHGGTPLQRASKKPQDHVMMTSSS
jgi:hypothetical protein